MQNGQGVFICGATNCAASRGLSTLMIQPKWPGDTVKVVIVHTELQIS